MIDAPPQPKDDLNILEVPKVVPYSARKLARLYYWRGWEPKQIADELAISPETIRTWKARDNWDTDDIVIKMKTQLEVRLSVLIAKENKTGSDFKEIDLLMRECDKVIRWEKYRAPKGHEGDLNPKIANRNAAPKKPPKKNYIDAEAKAKLLAAIKETLFTYQLIWRAAGHHRNRFILKSRQIGATFDASLEGLERALEFGFNQIFISASRAQANNFKNIIINFVEKHTGIRLSGDPMKITIEGVEDCPTFYFLGTNYMTAQGYSGDLTFDECFWVRDFARIKKVVSAVATLKKFRRTYLSTPSTTKHEAYEFWTGEEYNKNRAKDKKVQIDLKGDGIKKGMLFGDKVWRQIVTIEDAITGGNNEIDLEEIKDENSVETFENLYLCKFIDDSQSSFPLALIQSCMVDSWDKWKDFKPFQLSYKSMGKAWIAVDPSRSAEGDPAAIVVVLPPGAKSKKFRVVEKHKFKGLAFESLAKQVKFLCEKYDVEKIIVDKNGIGTAVIDCIMPFFPSVIGVLSPPHIKADWVYKGQSVFRQGRIEIDSGEVEIATDLMSIHPKLTMSQKQITYDSRRSGKGHGEYGWCILMALSLEPFNGDLQSDAPQMRIINHAN